MLSYHEKAVTVHSPRRRDECCPITRKRSLYTQLGEGMNAVLSPESGHCMYTHLGDGMNALLSEESGHFTLT